MAPILQENTLPRHKLLGIRPSEMDRHQTEPVPALTEYRTHYHHERNHQGKGNVLLFASSCCGHESHGPMQCRERLGGLLKYYEREAA